jgi:hypothetical protein
MNLKIPTIVSKKCNSQKQSAGGLFTAYLKIYNKTDRLNLYCDICLDMIDATPLFVSHPLSAATKVGQIWKFSWIA